MRIRFRLHPLFDLRTEEQKESYERIWKAWKMRTIPSSWRPMTLGEAKIIGADFTSLGIGTTGHIKIFTPKETHNVR